MSRLGPRRKAVVGQAHRFFWQPADGYPDVAPTLTVRFAAADVAVVLAAVRASDPITAVAADRRQLTTSSGTLGAALRGLISDYGGQAWLDGAGDFQAPVRVLRLISTAANSSVLELAEPLPHGVNVVGTWALRWNLWSGQIAAGDVGAAVQRGVRWSIPWTRRQGTDLPGEVVQDQGFLDIVRSPFATGLTDVRLETLVPGLARMVPGGQSSWAPQRDMALEELEAILAERLPATRYPDQLLGPQCQLAHALLTAAMVLRGHAALGTDRAAAALAYSEQADAEIERILRRPTWIDLDEDGVVDAGETDIDQTAAADLVGGFFGGEDSDFESDDFPAFARDGKH